MADRERLIALHSVLCRSIYAEYDEAQRAPVIDLLKTAENLIANGVVISNSETTTKWIPVTERLPEDRTQVLCFGGAYGWKSTKMARFTTCLEDYDKYDFEGQQRHGFFSYDSEYGYYEETDVTHWMYMPEPPKGE